MTVVVAEASGKRSHGTLVRRALAPDVDVQEVRAPGVIGRLFLPASAAPTPGVVLFPGSEGGLDSQSSNAALLASHGCAALVAATFAGDGPPYDGLPAQLERVPLERFTDAVRWLAGHEHVDAARVSAMAISRGSEGLLAAASRADDLPLQSIVAVSPSSATGSGSVSRDRFRGSQPGRSAVMIFRRYKPTIGRCCRTSPARPSTVADAGLGSAQRCCTSREGTPQSSTALK